MYCGTTMVSIPTANPATARPAKRVSMLAPPAWSAAPTTKTTTARSMLPLRPNLSEMGPLASDPSQASSSSVDTNQPL